jgi:hypothetical protein
MAKVHAETGPKKSKGRRGGPGLRRASNGIGRRPAVRLANEAAEQFRQTAQLLMAGRLEDGREDLAGFLDQPVPGKAKRDDRIVMRPDRAIMIGDWIVSRLAAGDGSDPPTAERISA